MSVWRTFHLQLLTPPHTTFHHTYTHLSPPKLSFPHRHFPVIRASSTSEVLVSDNNGAGPGMSSSLGSIKVDAVTETELKENGFRSMRRTKLVCTVGFATCGFEKLEALAVGGRNVARLNMCHGTREWHKIVIDRVRRLNHQKGFAVAGTLKKGVGWEMGGTVWFEGGSVNWNHSIFSQQHFHLHHQQPPHWNGRESQKDSPTLAVVRADRDERERNRNDYMLFMVHNKICEPSLSEGQNYLCTVVLPTMLVHHRSSLSLFKILFETFKHDKK